MLTISSPRNALWLVLLSALLIGFTPLVHASSYVAMDVKNSSGDFGSTIDDSVFSLNFSTGITEPAYDAEVSIPFLRRTLKGDGIDESDSGIGDILVRGGYRLLESDKKDLALYGSLAVKLATADENKGLGTGEHDYGFFLSLYKYWQNISASVFTGYRVNGDPDNAKINDGLNYGIGLSKFFGKASAYIGLEGQEALFDGYDNPLELQVGTYQILTPQWLFRGELDAGLSDASPAYGFSLGMIRLF